MVPDVNLPAQNITNHIMSLVKECIPNTMTRIRQREPQRLTANIKLYIRKRKKKHTKRLRELIFRMTGRTFKIIGNKVKNLIRESKRTCDEIEIYYDFLTRLEDYIKNYKFS